MVIFFSECAFLALHPRYAVRPGLSLLAAQAVQLGLQLLNHVVAFGNLASIRLQFEFEELALVLSLLTALHELGVGPTGELNLLLQLLGKLGDCFDLLLQLLVDFLSVLHLLLVVALILFNRSFQLLHLVLELDHMRG